MTRRDGTDVEVECGSFFAGERMLCERCERQAERDYPQGWRHSPGDVCRHGCYLGGASGPDLMCGRCENGED